MTPAIGVVAALFVLLPASLSQGRGQFGSYLFWVLSVYAFLLTCIAGIFLTAPIIQEEREEGTLVLLRLTPLSAWDHVLGKFVGQGLMAFLFLFSLAPLMALPLMLGGLELAEFIRMILVLFNSLFVSLALGMLVSALASPTQNVSWQSFCLILLLNGLLPLVSILFKVILGHSSPWLGIPSPGLSFFLASASHYKGSEKLFWTILLTSQTMGWFALYFASVKLFRGEKAPAALLSQPSMLEKSESKTRLVGDGNPVAWLLLSRTRTGKFVWALAWLSLVLAVTLTLFVGPKPAQTIVYFGLGLPLKFLMVVQSSRLFVESRSSGALELLLSSPLSNRMLLAGQWESLRRLFLVPVLIFAGSLSFCMLYGGLKTESSFEWFSPFFGFYPLIKFLLNIVSLALLSLWFSISLKKPKFAVPVTVLAGMILPSMLFCVPGFIIDLIIIGIIWGKLGEDLRSVLHESLAGGRGYSSFQRLPGKKRS